MGKRPIDLTGQRFGQLSVTASDGAGARGLGHRWLTKCDCGTETIVYGRLLRNGQVKSCGCLRNLSTPRPRRFLTGQRFGILTAGEKVFISGVQGPSYICACDCGGARTVRGKDLTSGNTKSCGCQKYAGLRSAIQLSTCRRQAQGQTTGPA